MSYVSVRQQLLKIASQPLPEYTAPKPRLRDKVVAAGAAAGGIIGELPEMQDSWSYVAESTPTLYECIKARVVIFIYHTIPRFTAGAH